jgi:DNA replication licensing factor MCM5
MPDKVKCHDFQILKLQEAPDSVPHGEMPRHMQLFVDRFLCDRVVPGNRVTVLGIYSIKKTGQVLQAVYSRKMLISCSKFWF